ncbi:Ldh family oxidoreductase [Paenibacillus cremeus]|uniref:Ldh family oxidoreductase n=1 Tax=Paenibacillus cremeus TaxID=2163881 RepID=A0A559K607_9BACL|nr:Ldh family oxidoreductase [Paenibacillus cremeus]TVY07526.1 Ldh family oxidoreductase [Paenibacillus cremeus]
MTGVDISLMELERLTLHLLQAIGLNEENAATVTEVFLRATYRGVGHHDVYELPGRLAGLEAGKVKANPSITRINKYHALENYEGDNGLGELCGMFIMRRAEQLADEYGIGLCAIRNTHHLLASTPYVEAAADNGYISYIVTRGTPTMGAPGRIEKVIGTSPMGYAIPTESGNHIMFDACLAYASNGVLAEKAAAGVSVPSYWGLDSEGRATEDPAAIAKGTRQPIGAHKGFGLTILGEILTGILSEGQIIDEQQPGTGLVGMPSHTAICIKADGLLGQRQLTQRTTEMANRMEARAAGLQLPGQRSARSRKQIISKGTIELRPDLVKKLNEWAIKLGVVPIILS